MKTAFVFLLLFFAAGASGQSLEPLRARNDFRTPEEVVRYFCARDAAGFIWAGMTSIEKNAYTTWQSVPHNDSFLIAKSYEIGQSRPSGRDKVLIEVTYQVRGAGDAHKTVYPPPSAVHRVEFTLKRTDGRHWKIIEPRPSHYVPVILDELWMSARERAVE